MKLTTPICFTRLFDEGLILMSDPAPLEASVSGGLEVSLTWLDNLTRFTMLFSLAAFAARVFEQVDVSFLGINIPIGATFGGFLIITALHFFVMKHILLSCIDAWKHLSLEERVAIYHKIVRTGGLMTKGAHAYRDAIINENDGYLKLKTELGDGPTWIHISLAVMCVLALVEFNFSWMIAPQTSVAVVIIVVNWQIGSNWVLALADLGSCKHESVFFEEGHSGPRPISHVSGFFIGRNVSFLNFAIGTVLEALLATLMFGVLFGVSFGMIVICVIVFQQLR